MSEGKNTPGASSEKTEKLRWGSLFYHNTFVLIFSLCVAVIGWFVMASGNTENNRIVSDIPINVTLSGSAAEEGIRVFNMNYSSADLEIAGNNLITNKLSKDDFDVSATLSPTSTKLTGNTMQKAVIQVRAAKKTSISDYKIVSINPEEITVEYDRYKESVFTIESTDVKYSADTGYYPNDLALSAEQVIISGPESSVNRIGRVGLSYTAGSPLRADTSFTCPIRLFDQNDQEISDPAALYLELDITTVDVSISILGKKTVPLRAATLHQPKGFADSRISIEPSQIDIAGTDEALASIHEITLDTPIDFADLDITGKNSFNMDIPLPGGVKNISTQGESTISQATVSINLNGYKKVILSVPGSNVQVINKPAGKEVSINTQSLEVQIIGSEAQANKLTGDAISVQVDMANYVERNGSVMVPATISVISSGSDSCWTLGKYSIYVTVSEALAVTVDADANNKNASSNTVAASPQE